MVPREISARQVGILGEQIAVEFLEGKGFVIVAKNYRKPCGEVDIIAKKAEVLHFVEVKSVSREMSENVSCEIGGYRPEERVGPSKIKNISCVAEMYLQENREYKECQIDVIGVFLDVRAKKARCRLYEQIG